MEIEFVACMLSTGRTGDWIAQCIMLNYLDGLDVSFSAVQFDLRVERFVRD